MNLTWVSEDPPVWDEAKKRVIGGAPEGAFLLPFEDGQTLPGEWWSARSADGTVVGYGRLDTTWGGDAEILLAVDAACQQQGAGSFILAHLEDEAAGRGINYVHNTIPEGHPERDLVHDWLVVRGFSGPMESVLRKRVRRHEATAARTERVTKPAEPYDADADPGSRPPGHEEAGGYVNIEDHQY